VDYFYEHIDDYMNGLLEGEALKQFEAEMEKDSSLKMAVENYASAKGISEGLLEVDMMETLRRLKESNSIQGGAEGNSQSEAIIHQLPKTDTEAKSKKQKFNIKRWLVAASMIGVIGFTGWWVMEMNERAQDKKYVLANYERPIDEDATKSIGSEETDPFKKGKELFRLNKFHESIPFFESYLSQVSDKTKLSEGYEWLGAAYLYEWKVEEAIKALRKSEEKKAKINLKLLLSSIE